MRTWFKYLDDLLRGLKTGPQQLAEGRLDLPLRMFVPLSIALGASYGLFMGFYAIWNRPDGASMQIIASMVKLPALFLLTLLVTLPSLYVFNALVGCRLTFGATLRLLVAAVVINLTVGASFGPILGFFTFSTTSYPFMILLNVLLLGIAGLVALGFLLHVLRRLAAWQATAPPRSLSEAPDAKPVSPAELSNGNVYDPSLGQARSIFRVWVIIYSLVGAQMAWLLRPFVGSPDMAFTWFRGRDSNFFQAVFNHVQKLFSVD